MAYWKETRNKEAEVHTPDWYIITHLRADADTPEKFIFFLLSSREKSGRIVKKRKEKEGIGHAGVLFIYRLIRKK